MQVNIETSGSKESQKYVLMVTVVVVVDLVSVRHPASMPN